MGVRSNVDDDMCQLALSRKRKNSTPEQAKPFDVVAELPRIRAAITQNFFEQRRNPINSWKARRQLWTMLVKHAPTQQPKPNPLTCTFLSCLFLFLIPHHFSAFSFLCLPSGPHNLPFPFLTDNADRLDRSRVSYDLVLPQNRAHHLRTSPGGWDLRVSSEAETLNPTPYTLHPTPNTPHPTPHTLNSKL
jgi:hypothetical protein